MLTRIRLQRAAILAALFVVLLLSATGCARVGALSEVNPDGSLNRTVTFRGPAPSSGGMSMGPKLDDLLDAPKGAGWKITRAVEETELVVTATRTVPAGTAAWSDIVIRDEPKSAEPPGGGAPGPAGPAQQAKPRPGQKPPAKPGTKPAPKPTPPPDFDPGTGEPKTTPGPIQVTNEVSVRPVAAGRLEYREVFKWSGTRPDDLSAPDAEAVKALASALPPAVAGDPALVKAIGDGMAREVLHSLFGPGEPILPLLLFHQDYAEFRLRGRLTRAIRKVLDEKAADRMSEDQRKAATKEIVATLTKSITSKSKVQTNPATPPGGESSEGKKDGGSPIAIFVRVKMPGKVVSTNGEYDEDSGEVVWALYSQAAGFEDVVLTAVCEVTK